MDASAWIEKGWAIVLDQGPVVLWALVTLVVGLWIVGLVARLLRKAFERGKVEPGLRNFLGSLVSTILKVMVLIAVAGKLGIQTTSFVAILGAAGLAVGLALQGSLANFAGGVLVLLFKPYKVGDFIDAQGVSGTVKEIQVFNTVITTPDNKTIIVPNGAISNGIITNISTQPTRRVDMTFGIGYSDDIQKTKEVLRQLVEADERVLKDPAPVIVCSALADSSVNFAVRAWCNSGDYWGIFFDMQEKVKEAFDANGISIPFPQRDIHVYNETK